MESFLGRKPMTHELLCHLGGKDIHWARFGCREGVRGAHVGAPTHLQWLPAFSVCFLNSLPFGH